MSETGPEELEPLIAVARAVKTRGLKGEIVAELLTDFPERFQTISRLIGVAQNGQRRIVELERYWFHQDRLVLKLAGYDSIEAASALIGYDFAVPESEKVPLAEDQFYNWELEGCLVEIVGGKSIGKVREVMTTRGMNTLVVADDEHHEYLIPVAPAIVLHVDIAHKRIQVDPPEGLLEL